MTALSPFKRENLSPEQDNDREYRTELMILGIGTITAFVSSLLIIRFLMSFVKKHDFKVFGWYRIILGIAVLAYFMLAK